MHQERLKSPLCDVHPMGLKFIIKVLGKEFEEQPFFKRVFLNSTYQMSIYVLSLKCGDERESNNVILRGGALLWESDL